MIHGALDVIKTIGESPVFILSDKHNGTRVIIPNITDWLMKRLGKEISLKITKNQWKLEEK